MSSLAALAIYAQQLDGWALPLGEVSSPNEYKVQLNSADDLVYATVNGGPWTPIFGAGGLTGTLQEAYDDGGVVGSGGGRSITSMAGGPVVLTQSAALAALEINISAANGRAAAITMGAATSLTALDVALTGVSDGISILKTNNSAGGGETCVRAQDVATGASGGRAGTLASFSELSTFTANGSFASPLFSITSAPISSGAATTLTLNQSILKIAHAPTTAAAGTITDTTTGLSITMTPQAVGSVVTGLSISGGQNSIGQAISIGVRNRSGTIFGTSYNAVSSLTADLVGWSIDLATNLTAATHQATGLLVAMGNQASANASVGISATRSKGHESTAAASNWSGSLVSVSNTPTIQNVLVNERGVLVSVSHAPTLSGAATYVDTTTGLLISLSPAVASAVTGISVSLSALATNSNFVSLSDVTTASNSNNGLAWARTATPANGSTWTGSGVSISNTPTGTNTVTENGVLLKIVHQPIAGAGAITDTTTGMSIAMTSLGGGAMTGLSISVTPGASVASTGQTVTMGANATGYGLRLVHLGSNAGATAIAMSVSGGDNHVQGIELADGRNIAVSNANQGRFRYNSFTQAFEMSSNGAAFVALTSSLQSSYNGGASILVTAANPVSIFNATATSSDLLTLTCLAVATNANKGINYTRSGAPTGASTYSGSAILVNNAPTGTNSFAESGTLVSINHLPGAGAGTITDTTIGLGISMQPATAASVVGQSITMLSTGAGSSALKIDYRSAAGNTSGVISMLVGSGTVLTGALTMVNIDAKTNVTPGTQTVTGVALTISSAAGSNASQGYKVTRSGIAQVVGSVFSGNLVNIQNTPTGGAGGVTSTENGVLLNVNHAPVAGAAAITDTTTGLSVTITPASSSDVFGAKITMGANTSANGAAITFGTGAPAGMSEILGPTDKNLIITSGGATRAINFVSNGNTLQLATDGSVLAPGALSLVGKTTKYNNITTAGWGTPAVYGAGRSTAQAAAVASVATYTVGASDGSFLVSANLCVTASTTFSINVQIAYTDETNTAQTVTLNFQTLGGTILTAITNVQGAGPYEGIPVHIRAKAATTITVKTTGTFTTVTYNVEGIISQVQ